jgi:hypothetical protein
MKLQRGVRGPIVVVSLAAAGMVLCWGCGSKRPTTAAAAPFVAYSMRQAERAARGGSRAPEVIRLGGITRLAGMVYDAEGKDLILVGQVVAGEREITLDHLVAAIRARLVHNAWPLVSIDRTPDTARTGMQRVRLEGGVERTAYGADLVAADVVLKKIGLGLIEAGDPGLRSYFDLALDYARLHGADEAYCTRFWFLPLKAGLASREGVFAIQELQIGIQAQVVGGRVAGQTITDPVRAHDPMGDRFAGSLSARYGALQAAHPAVRRLKVLFDLAGIAEGIRSLEARPDMTYWAREYAVAPADTPTEHALLTRSAEVEVDGARCRMTTDGGIEMKALMSSLRDGDVTALRTLVLRSRPDAAALTWRVPLGGWPIPGYSDPAAAPADEDPPAVDGIGCNYKTTFESKGVRSSGAIPIAEPSLQASLRPHGKDAAQASAPAVGRAWPQLDPQADLRVFKVNTVFDTDRPTGWPGSHSYIAVYDMKSGKVVETYSFVDTNHGMWEDPWAGGKVPGNNMRGAQDAIDQHLATGRWCAKELGGGRPLVQELRKEFDNRSLNPERWTYLHNCKVEANHLFDAAQQRALGGDLGGVSMDVRPTRTGSGGRAEREAVLRGRPSDTVTTWEIGLPSEKRR